MFIQFHQKESSVYINTDKIVSIYEDVENQTMITTVNPNEFYQVSHSIEEVTFMLKCREAKIYSTIKNQ